MFDMSFMGAMYPMVIGVVGLLYLVVIFLFGKKKMYKTAITLVVLGAAFTMYAPIKIDGTNSTKHHKVTSELRSAEYKEVQAEAKIVEVVKPTFDERLAQEALRSEAATKKTQDEIIK